jgi:ribosomal protein S18 acetylase RimI-like enzyme
MDSLTYRVDCAPVDEVARHLSGCSADFTPSLDSRVDVNSYATKLRATARTFEAWSQGHVVGLVAVYVNVPESRMFISSVSVDQEFRRHGIARSLLVLAICDSDARGMAEMQLEVDSRTTPAVMLYEELGFTTSRTDGPNALMIRHRPLDRSRDVE